MEDIRCLGTLLVLDSRLYEGLNVHIMQACEETSERRRTTMMEMFAVMLGSLKEARSYEKKK